MRRRLGSAVRIGLGGLVRRRSPGTLGQLGGFGHTALGYGEDDLACSPAVYRGRPTRRDGQRYQTVHPWRVEDPQVRHADSHPPWGMPAAVWLA